MQPRPPTARANAAAASAVVTAATEQVHSDKDLNRLLFELGALGLLVIGIAAAIFMIRSSNDRAAPAHGDHACSTQEPDGKLGAQCFHDGCAGRRWPAFKDKIGPPEAHHYDPPLRRTRVVFGDGANGANGAHEGPPGRG